MEPAFDEALFSMKTGETSDPIRTTFGFHVIQLKEIKAGGTKSFEEVRGEVERTYRHEQAERVFFEQAEQLANLTFENPDTLGVASKALDLEIKESDYLSRSGEEGRITANPKVIEAAFSPEVLEERRNSEPLEIESDHLVVVRVQEHKPAEPRKLEEVRDEIINKLKLERAKSALEERGRKLLERLKAGEDRLALAKQEGFEWQEAKGVDQEGAGSVNRTILRTAFKLGRVSDGKPIYSGVPMGTGDYALVTVLKVQDPDPQTVEEKLRKETRDQLLASLSTREWQDFMTELRNRAQIQIHSDKL
jgi:peptidyl-prolyl cis-trans isomerase D